MYLILTEKPSAMKSFAAALGGNSGTINGKPYVLASLLGHVMEFVEPHEMVQDQLVDQFQSWALNMMPWDLSKLNWKRRPTDSGKKFLQDVKQKAAKASAIIIATDTDPSGEGDLIAWEAIDAIGYKGDVYRLDFVDEAAASIVKAFDSLRKVDKTDGAYVKAEARSRFDFASMQLTRIATGVARQSGVPIKVSRQGRLKSVMLSIVYQREQEIANYTRKPYYEVKFKDENGHIYSRTLRDEDADTVRFADKADGERDKATYTDSPVNTPVVTRKSSAPPALFELSGLSGVLAKQGFDAKLVLATYQKMYEATIVSYPRTEDKFISTEQFNEMLPLVDRIAGVVGVDTKLLTHRTPRKTHVKDGGAHGANRPGKTVPSSLSAIETTYGACGVAIYTNLAKNFLAMFGEDYVYDAVKANLAKYPAFETSFTIPVELNYKLIYDADAAVAEDDDESTDATKSCGKQASPYVFEGANKKPSKPTMTWLMNMLNRYEVGTGATRTSTFAEITAGAHAMLATKKNAIATTDVGKVSALVATGSQIASVDVTKQLFQAMDEVGKKQRQPQDILNMIDAIVRHDLQAMSKNAPKLAGIQLKGAAAKGAYVQKEKRTMTINGQDVAFNTSWGSYAFTDAELDTLASGGSVKVEFLTKTKERCIATGSIQQQEYNGRTFYGFKPTDVSYPDRVVKEKVEAVGESGEAVAFNRTWGGYRFDDAEVAALSKGETITIQFKNKDGVDCKATGCIQQQEYNGRTFYGFKPTAPITRLDGGGGGGASKSTKEKVTGVFAPLNKEITFTREFSGYRFTDREVTLLLQGKEIEVPYTTKFGKASKARGKLEEQVYNGTKYFGFKAAFGDFGKKK